MVLPCQGVGQKARVGAWDARCDEVIRLVLVNFHDPRAAAAWAARNRGYAAAVRSDAEFADLTQRALSQLQTSHTSYYGPRDRDYNGILAIYGAMMHAGDGTYVSCGVDVNRDGFLRVVFAGGAGAAAGLKRGDRIVSADGKPFDPIGPFAAKARTPVYLTVERTQGRERLTIPVRPRLIAPRREWMEALNKGARLIARNGKIIAYVPMFACAGEEYEIALRQQLSTRLAAADSLIIDFRDGWGGCNPDFVNLFNPVPPILTSIGRDGKAVPFDYQWRKPLFLLINGGSRSGKELVAYSIKNHRLGTLVGRRTAGAVVAGRGFMLSDRSVLLLAVADVRVDGERLEGRGVEPDVEVPDGLPYAGGADPQLDRAVELATGGKQGYPQLEPTGVQSNGGR